MASTSVEANPPTKKEDPEWGDDYDDLKKPTDTNSSSGNTAIDTSDLPMREFKFKIPGLKGELLFNPVVSLIGLVPLWGLTAFCMVQPTEANALLGQWFTEVINAFTWFYIGKFQLYL